MTCFQSILSRLLTLLLLLFFSGSALTENVTDLYVAEIPVKGQGGEARRGAIARAFNKVLVKVTGERNLASRAGLKKMIGRANSYVQQYSYRLLDTGQGEPSTANASQATVDRLLRVRFDENALNRDLRKHGISVWGNARPSTLIWLGLEQRGRRSIVQPENQRRLRNALMQVSRERGLPILFPLMDIEDSSQLQVSDLWGGFEEAIRRASDRYLPDVILVGRLRERARGDWTAEWSLYQPDGVSTWRTRASSQYKLATGGLDRAADDLAARFAPRYAEQGVNSLRVRVSGLHNLADYVLVKDYLESLGLIEQLDLLTAHPDRISFLAKVHGGRNALEKSILLGGVLETVVSADEVPQADATSPEYMDAESLDFRLRQ